MKLPLLALASLITSVAGAAPSGVSVPPAEPLADYAVRPGDTLIGKGRSMLRAPGDWREVARLNRLPNPNRIVPGQHLRIPFRLLRSSVQPAQVVIAQGDVRVDGTPVAAGAPVAPGQRLTTAQASSAVLRLGDGTRVKLAPASEAGLAEHRRFDLNADPSGSGQQAEGLFASTMRLVRGSIEVLASKLARAKPLEVTTPTAVIGVRGTEYRVHWADAGDAGGAGAAAPAATGTEVLSGRVQADVTGASGAEVATGYGARLQSGQAPQVAALSPAPDLGSVPARFERPVVRFKLPAETLGWRVQVAADDAFERIVRDERVPPAGEARITGLDDGRWQLRVRRIDTLDIEGFDARREFVLKARPEPPAALAPLARAKLPVGPVALSWAENTEATSYRVEVARDAAFQQVVASQGDLPRAKADVSLSEAGSYLWRIASIRAGGDLGPWGDAQPFELRPLPTPPQGGLSGDGSRLELKWSGRAEDHQQVELARDAGFKDVVAQADLSEARWALATPSQPGEYFFRYRAVESDGFTTPWSSTLRIEVPRDWRFLWMLLPAVFML
jgi:hypothetical protein